MIALVSTMLRNAGMTNLMAPVCQHKHDTKSDHNNYKAASCPPATQPEASLCLTMACIATQKLQLRPSKCAADFACHATKAMLQGIDIWVVIVGNHPVWRAPL